MELRPFDPQITCPACGAERPQLRYCVGRGCTPIQLGGIVEDQSYLGDQRQPTRHLHWTCARCGYEDLMACAPLSDAVRR
jgi:hypothetical protein